MTVPAIRIRKLNGGPVDPNRDFVLYWMIANRRPGFNFSLQRAVEWCRELNKPLVILEALRCGYSWASDRIHRFVLQGMASNRAAFEDTCATYYCYVEPKQGAGSGLLDSLADRAAIVVTDDFPCFFLPRMLKGVSARLPIAIEAIDSNGLLPMRAATRIYPTAYSFRRFLQKELLDHLVDPPQAAPLSGSKLPALKTLPQRIRQRWPEASGELLAATTESLAALPIDHKVGPAAFNGGAVEAEKTLYRFIKHRFRYYGESRNEPDKQVTSELSPYLHFGHISAHQVFESIVHREKWSPDQVASQKPAGKRLGWWGMSDTAEGFLDEVITWRELGYNMCWQREDYDQYESLPEWAQTTLGHHELDTRDPCYTLEEFEAAETHDRLWNAAQTQLVREGRLHNYMRMLWGKKILHWSQSPRHALQTMIHLNNKYAVDGRNPNSYSGIFWCLGRYDRAWGPERPIFGKIRYMSSKNTARKLKVTNYLNQYAPPIDG